MEIEPVTEGMVDALIRAVGPMSAQVSGLYEVDLERGRGVLGKLKHCLWDTSGRRITVVVSSDGGVIISRSKEKDGEDY